MNKCVLFFLVIGLVLCFSVPLTAFSENAQDYFQRAASQYFLGNLDEAILNLNKSLSLDPAYPAAKQLLNSIFMEKGIKHEPAGKREGAENLAKIRNEINTIAQAQTRKYLTTITFAGFQPLALSLLVGLSAFSLDFFLKQKGIIKKEAQITACAKCNTKYRPKDKFCSNCGNKIRI